nr:BTB POZ domain-containing protein [Megavirus caiporensis]
MDFSKIFNSEKLSDIKLILVDKYSGKKCLNLHKVILHTGSPFFEKMFDNFKEKNQSEIVLEVFNVDVFSNILESFYGIKIEIRENWKYQLANYVCRQYLLLECKIPETLKIPENEFNEFLNITQSFEYTDEIINLVAENLPIDFDLDKLSIELIREIEKKYIDYQFLALGEKSINIIDINNNNINTIIKGDLYSFDYAKDFDIIITKSGKNSKYIFYNLDGNLLNLNEINEKNNKYRYLSENLNDKHLKYGQKLLGNLGQICKYYNYSSDYKNIIFVTYSVDYDSEDDENMPLSYIIDRTNNKYYTGSDIENDKPQCIFIYNIDNQNIEKIYGTTFQYSPKYIQNQPLFINNKVIFIEDNYNHLEVKIYSVDNGIVKTIYNIDIGINCIKYNGDDLILISTGVKNKVFSLCKNKIINEFNLECDLNKIDFVSEEIIVASKTKGKYTHIFLYNIITGLLLKTLIIELKINDVKCISINSPIKNKLRKYLDNY